jgi:membrane protein YqaA with SNARE-associated domain
LGARALFHPVSRPALVSALREALPHQASGWYERFGLWTLLFAWLPLVGDPLTVLAGAFRVRFFTFLLLVSIGKLGRYLFVIGVALAWFGPAA